MDNHYKQQEEGIAEALSELLSGHGNCNLAYHAIIGAIDGWLTYYEAEAQKWRALREKITNAPWKDNGGLVEF